MAKTVRQRIAERLEAEADELWRVFREAFDATQDDGAPDHRARLAAAEGALAQAFGRPAQEIIGDPDQPVAIILGSLLARAREELGE